MKRLALLLALFAVVAARGAPQTFPPRPAAEPVGANEITISSPSGGVARINLFGGVVTSWVPAGGTEVFAMARPYATCARGEQIHGGLPMCWPWFVFEGPEKCRIHGITRYFDWKVKARRADALTITLDDSPATRAYWPHAFHLELTYSFAGTALRAEFRATNTGTEPYACTEGFHPYFRVGELDACTVTGSDGTKYFWKGEIEKGDQRRWTGDFPCRLLGLGKPGYVFEEGPHRHLLKDPALGRTLDVTYENNIKFVLFGWTPDFSALGGSDDPAFGRHFVCLEGGTLYRDRAYLLRPGETHRLAVTVAAR